MVFNNLKAVEKVWPFASIITCVCMHALCTIFISLLRSVIWINGEKKAENALYLLENIWY